MKNFPIKANIVILILLISNYVGMAFIKIPVRNSDSIKPICSTSNWKSIENFDNLLIKNSLTEFEPQSDRSEINSNDQIKFVIKFPKDYDYSNAISILENYGGIIKYKYSYAINGFSAILNSENFSLYCADLDHNNISFHIEEDIKVKTNLYYVSRNMNLRPYLWNTYNGGYDGDNTSAIAILDTGIDDSHPFFPGGYLDKDYTSKIIGWNDIFSGSPTLSPEDINGHGTHVAAIAAGEGSPQLDYKGRVVGTSGLNLDFVGQLDEPLLEDYYYVITVARFNVTEEGLIEVECHYTDSTILDNMYGGIHLLHGNNEVNSTDPYIYLNFDLNLTYNVGIDELGIYELEFRWYPEDNTGDGGALNPDSRFRGIIHYPFDPPLYGCGDPFKGVAPDARIVGVKVLGDSGGGTISDIIDGVEWVINHKTEYNITIMSMSLGTKDDSSDENLVDAVNNAVEAGIVTIVAAGNSGSGGDKIGSPGDAEKVITVAAMNNHDQITSYSSQGGLSYDNLNIKPDITAPGGSYYDLTMFSADSNEGDVDGAYISDFFNDDLYSAQGTSMAAPVVAGATSLLIEAMGGRPNWQYTEEQTLLVKSLLLMSATETINWREQNIDFSPTLDRGNKDVHEGYGRINIDAAIEAWTNNLTSLIESFGTINVCLNTSQYNAYGKHAYGGYVNLKEGIKYSFNLSVPIGADYDLYLYNATPNEYGEPIITQVSRSSIKGRDEFFNYTAENSAKYFILVKAVGDPLPSEEEDDDEDENPVTTINFLTILIIASAVALVAITIIIIIYKKSKSDNTYNYIPDY